MSCFLFLFLLLLCNEGLIFNSMLSFILQKKKRPHPLLSSSLSLPLRARSLERDLLPNVPPRPLAEPVRARVGLDAGPVLVGDDAPAQAAVALDPALRLLFVCFLSLLLFFLLIPLSSYCCGSGGLLPCAAAIGLLLLLLLFVPSSSFLTDFPLLPLLLRRRRRGSRSLPRTVRVLGAVVVCIYIFFCS